MNQQAFESELKKEGYDVMTNTTPGAKVNPEDGTSPQEPVVDARR